MPFISITLLVIAAIILILLVIFWKRVKENMAAANKPLFVSGILLALIGAALMWNGDLLGESTTGIATILGIVGIGLIAASNASTKFKKP